MRKYYHIQYNGLVYRVRWNSFWSTEHREFDTEEEAERWAKWKFNEEGIRIREFKTI